MSIILNQFPSGTTEATDFSTFRVELIIRLFTQICDKVNFDFILRILLPKEISMIIFRLGWLNIFSPLKIQGAFAVDLSRRDDRQLAKLLIYFNHVESKTSKENLNAVNYLDGKGSADGISFIKSDFEVPVAWHRDISLPNTGIYSILYGEVDNRPHDSNDLSNQTESSDSIVFTRTDTFSDIDEEQIYEDFEGAYNDRHALQACVLTQYNGQYYSKEKVLPNHINIIKAVELMTTNEFDYIL